MDASVNQNGILSLYLYISEIIGDYIKYEINTDYSYGLIKLSGEQAILFRKRAFCASLKEIALLHVKLFTNFYKYGFRLI